MTVEDKYVNAAVASGDKAASTFAKGVVKSRVGTFGVAAADDNGSVYRVFKSVSVDEVIIDLVQENSAITGGTDYEIGIYSTGVGGAALDIDLFAGTKSYATASTLFGNNGLLAVAIGNKGVSIKTLYETVSGLTLTDETVDIAVTANTVGTVAGTVTLSLKSK